MTLNTLRLVMFQQMKQLLALGLYEKEAVYLWQGNNILLLPSAIGKRSALPRAQPVAAVVDSNIRSLGGGRDYLMMIAQLLPGDLLTDVYDVQISGARCRTSVFPSPP